MLLAIVQVISAIVLAQAAVSLSAGTDNSVASRPALSPFLLWSRFREYFIVVKAVNSPASRL